MLFPNTAISGTNIAAPEQSGNNDFFLARQFWISGDYGRKRADLVGFVNGIPPLFMELKASHRALVNAYNLNLSDYRTTIPQVFWYNCFIVLSNGSQSKIGSISAGWEHFAEWKKINSEGEEGLVSLDTMIRGVCEPRRLLDLVENFSIYSEEKGGPQKLVAKNHQFLGVNNAIAAVQKIKANQGKLGVFWHTQGSGMSVSGYGPAKFPVSASCGHRVHRQNPVSCGNHFGRQPLLSFVSERNLS
jgi:type I restriction enzyme R subunit